MYNGKYLICTQIPIKYKSYDWTVKVSNMCEYYLEVI